MAFLQIFKGRGSAKTVVGQALVDDELLPQLQHLSLWYNGGYPAATVGPSGGTRKVKRLHYIVWELKNPRRPVPAGRFLDHVNQDLNDNRIENLAIVDRSTQVANAPRHRDNSTGYKGVHKSGKKFEGCIGHAKEKLYLGRYDRACEAAHAVNHAFADRYKDVPTPNRIPPDDLTDQQRQQIEANVMRLLHRRRRPRQPSAD